MKIFRSRKIKCIALIISILVFITGMILQKNNINLVGFILVSLSCAIIFSSILISLIEINLKPNKNGKRTFLALVINLIFSIFPTAFIVHYSNNLITFITSLIALILLLIIVYRLTNIENGNDISLLKATNYFIAFLLTAIKLLNIEKTDKVFFIDFYFLLPLIIAQGLYELFDGKAKRKSD